MARSMVSKLFQYCIRFRHIVMTYSWVVRVEIAIGLWTSSATVWKQSITLIRLPPSAAGLRASRASWHLFGGPLPVDFVIFLLTVLLIVAVLVAE